MGVKVTLNRDNGASFKHKDYGLETRIFDNGKSWQVLVNGRILVLDDNGDTIVVFMPNTVESVEFISRESKIEEMNIGGTVTIKQSREELFTPITAEGILDTVSRKELSEAWEVIKTRPLFRDNFGKYCGPDCDLVEQCMVAKMNALLKKS